MIRLLLVLMGLSITMALNAQRTETIVQRTSAGDARDFTISSDGTLLAKLNNDVGTNEVEIWNTRTGHLVQIIAPQLTSEMEMITTVRFWKKGKVIITGSTYGRHQLYDVASGKLIKTLPVFSGIRGLFAVNEATGIMAYLHPSPLQPSAVVFYDLFSNTRFDSLEMKTPPISALEFSADGKKLALGTDSATLHIYEMGGKVAHLSQLNKTAIRFLQWTPDNYLLVEDKQIFFLMDMRNLEIANADSVPGMRIVTSPVEPAFYLSTKQKMTRLNGDRQPQRSYGIDADDILNVDYSNDLKRMYIQTRHYIKSWNLENIAPATGTSNIASGLEAGAPLVFLPAAKGLLQVKGTRSAWLPVDTTYTTTVTETDAITNATIFRVSDAVYFQSAKGIARWQNGTVKTTQLPIDKLLAVQDEEHVYLAAGGVLQCVNTRTGKSNSLKIKEAFICGAVSPKGDVVVAGNKLLLVNTQANVATELYDAAKEDFVVDYYGSISRSKPVGGLYRELLFSPDGKKLFARNIFGQVKVWDIEARKIDTILYASAEKMYYPAGLDQLVLARRNELLMLNPSDYSLKARYAFLASGDYIVSLADNYYKASRNGSKAIAFRTGTTTSSFDQYDVLYNRPDIVTERLGNPTAETKTMLRKLVERRWAKSGYTPQSAASVIDPPQITIRNYGKIPVSTTQRELQFVLEASDNNNSLQQAFIFVNGVPLRDKSGVSLTGKDGTPQNAVNLRVTLLLEQGNNRVEVSCTNSKGIQSPRLSFEVFYKDTTRRKPNLIFIGIAAANYADSSYNLKYPQRDVADIAKLFASNRQLFGNVQTHILSNRDVTKENIARLKTVLDSTDVDDYVIIHWSGHGLLNKDLDYYLATYDINFEQPEQRGLEYSQLEDLLNSIPARKRLLFIDACHSGEVDKSETSFVRIPASDTTNKKNTKGISFRETKTSASSELLKDLFVDVRRQTGATIISAAGGAEFALEGDNWGYGVFSYAIIQGLQDKQADLNHDGIIYISELQTYLQQTVQQLTGGRQRPTSRTENIVNDFRMW